MWPPEALEFLRELEDNNDREWFKANRARYDAYLFDPAIALAEKLRHLGEARTFRPYNDTRFHPRPPIKEHLGVAIGYGSAGGYYFELSLDGLLVAAGMYRPAPDQLERYRAAIDDGERTGGAARSLVNGLRDQLLSSSGLPPNHDGELARGALEAWLGRRQPAGGRLGDRRLELLGFATVVDCGAIAF